MPSPVTVAVRLPVVEGVNEKFDAAIVSSALALLAGKVTVYSRLLSQGWAWVMVTFTSSASVVSPSRRQREEEVLQPRADAYVLRLDGDGGVGGDGAALRRALNL